MSLAARAAMLSRQIEDLETRAAVKRKDPAQIGKILRARKDFDAFVEYCFLDTVSQLPIRQGAIHRQWTQHCQAYSRALIKAPREHGKTEQMAVYRPIWRLGNNPELRFKILGESDGLAIKRLTSIKGHVLRNARVCEVFPHLRPHPGVGDWSKHTITVERQSEDKDPSIEALGVLSSGVGGRADEIIFDDVVGFRNAIVQPALRGLVKETIANVWLNLLVEDGRAIYIYTPWHEDDASAGLERNPAWALLEQPIPEDLTPIWPEMWSRERLAQRRAEIGPRAFARGFHLQALSDEDQLFRGISRCLRSDLSLADVDPAWPRFVGVDLGHAKRKASARSARNIKPYSVIFTIALDPDKRRWPVSIRRGYWSGPDTARQILEVHEQHRSEVILVESNAYQATVIDWIKLVTPDASIPVQPFVTGANKADEQIGLPGLSAEFDNGAWIIPTDGLTEADLQEQWPTAWTAWYNEMRGYPAASLTDTVMACWFAREAARRVAPAPAQVGSEDREVRRGQVAALMGEGHPRQHDRWAARMVGCGR